LSKEKTQGLSHRSLALFALAIILTTSSITVAQQPVKLSTVLTTFLADAGVQTRGLPWTTANSLPVKWETAKPGAAAEVFQRDGLTLRRAGKFRLSAEGGKVVDAYLEVFGNDTGIQRVQVNVNVDELPLEAAEKSLAADGIQLSPLKCNRKTEGTSFGNLVYVMKAPGKIGTGLWEQWNCSAKECYGGFTIIYRKAELSKVECASQ